MREAAGLEQEEVAQRVGIHRQTLSKYERGAIKKVPSGVISALAAIYGVTSDELLTGDPIAVRRLVSRCTSRDRSPIVGETLSPYGQVRRPLNEILKGRRALEWLIAFRDEVRALGGNAFDEERAIAIATSPLSLSLFVSDRARHGLGEDAFTEDEALRGMERFAALIRDELIARARERGDDTEPRTAKLEDTDTPAERPSGKGVRSAEPFVEPMPDMRPGKGRSSKRSAG